MATTTTITTITAIIMAMDTITAIPITSIDATAAATRLLIWFSPGFPTGAYAFSHGLEWAVEAGDVTDRASLAAWLDALLAHGGPYADAVLAAEAWRLARAADAGGLAALAGLALALQPSRERRLETSLQGDAFLKAAMTGWPSIATAAPGDLPPAPTPLPVAVGMAAAGARLAVEATLTAFLTGTIANLVSAALRLAPIGQSDGLRVLAALEPRIAATAARAATATLDDLGTCALRSDVASMRHETQETRLFRS